MADVEEHLAKFAHQAITDPVGLRRGHLLQQVLALVLGKFFIGNIFYHSIILLIFI